MNENILDMTPPSIDFCMMDYDCSYIEGNKVRMSYKYIENPKKSYNTKLIQRGWRRFGCYYFYPICNGCNECKSLRIDIENFTLNSSQKKALKRNKDTKIVVQKPSYSKFHIDLYNRYHRFKSDKDEWLHRDISINEYKENFVYGASNFGKEVLYIRDDKLVGVDLIDILDDGISSIYFFYDPDYLYHSLGTYSLLYQIQLARKMKLRWIYLGYWVDGCKAFAYKPNFKPLEVLDGFPDITQNPKWEAFNFSC